MSAKIIDISNVKDQLSVEKIKYKIRSECESIIDFCTREQEGIVGERMDCSGMRWIPERAEALLHLRCVELNGDWDKFFDWAYKNWRDKLGKEEKVMVRTNEPIELLKAA